MTQRDITVTVGPNGTLTAIDYPKADAHPGDVIVWRFHGPRGNHWIGIGDFRKHPTGNAKNPTTKAYYSIAPTDPGEARAKVKGPDDVIGLYKYRIVSIRVPKMQALASKMCAQRKFAAQAEYVLKAMMGSDVDSELDPEVQIGG
jgi:hypothetical protein